MKNVHCISTKQHGGMKSGVAIQELNHFVSGVCWCTILLKGVKVKHPYKCESVMVLGVFCGGNGKT